MTARFLTVTPTQLEDVLRGHAEASDLLFPDDEGVAPGSLDIDKSWHAIHYLLTGDPWEGAPPLSRAILGGEPVGDDLGYGPARYLVPSEVADIAAALDTVSVDMLRERFGDGARLTDAEIYPGVWHAADEGRAMLLFIV